MPGNVSIIIRARLISLFDIIHWAATKCALVRAPRTSLNFDQLEASISLIKALILAFSGEK
jgi:hypothetical protein